MPRVILNLLCAGAAQGLVKALQARWLSDTGADIGGRFGAVGAMKEALFAGEPCDVLVSTDRMIGELVEAGRLRGDTRAPLGRVRTGIAVRRGEHHPDVSTPEALKAALLAADAIYFPDALRSTAGIHFASVMRELGILDRLEPRFRTYPNGATAMRELAVAEETPGRPKFPRSPSGGRTPQDGGLGGTIGASRLVGCTQVTEIRYTDGVELVAPLPARFELATVYTAAVSANAADPALAARFVALLAGAQTQALREAGGFEP